MTQFVPYVPGTPNIQRRNTAALALLETNDRVVVLEQQDSTVGRPSLNSANVSGKLHGFKKTAAKAGVLVGVATERDGDTVRGIAWKLQMPLDPITTEVLTVTESAKPRTRSTKDARDASALSLVLNLPPGRSVVTVSSTPFDGRVDGLTRKQLQSRYGNRVRNLNKLAASSGLAIRFESASTKKNIRIDGRKV